MYLNYLKFCNLKILPEIYMHVLVRGLQLISINDIKSTNLIFHLQIISFHPENLTRRKTADCLLKCPLAVFIYEGLIFIQKYTFCIHHYPGLVHRGIGIK